MYSSCTHACARTHTHTHARTFCAHAHTDAHNLRAGFRAAAQPAVLEAAGTTAEAALGKARLLALLATCGAAKKDEVGALAMH